MLNLMKVVALVGQLVLSFHGEGHPPHDEHRDEKRIHASVSR